MTNPAERPIRLDIPSLALDIPDEASAYELLERLRWPERPICPHCGSAREPYFLTPQGEGRKTRTGKVSPRRVWKCAECRKQFSVLTGTIFHGTKIPIRTWLFVTVEMCASKNGVAAREVERKYNLTPKSAWYMTQRIRAAMAQEPGGLLPMVGTVIADEAYIGGRTRKKHGTFTGEKSKAEKITPPKTPVITLINTETGEARSRVVPSVTAETLANAVLQNVDVDRARLFTDEHQGYKMVGRWMGLGHEAVNHGQGEYVRGDVTTNPVESFFSQLKRSIDGTHHHVSPEHLHRYLAEFDFRHSTRELTDAQRVSRLMGQTRGRRVRYRGRGA